MNSSYCVLVVDDEPSIGKLLLKELTTPARCVHVAASAREARDLLAKNEYEVAVLDIRLPDANGLELAREVAEIAPNLPIILVSGRLGDIEDRELAGNIKKVVLKPFNQAIISAAIREVLDAKPQTIAA